MEASPSPGRTQGDRGPGTAAFAGLLLVTVTLVPAAAPTATAVEVAGGSGCSPPDDPFDVGLVLDRSGSMAGTPLQEAKEGSIRLLQNLTPNDQSGLVSYADAARLDDPLSFDHGSTAEAVADLSSGGNTATGSAIDLSHDDFTQRGRSDANHTMILLTDGITNEGPDPVQEAKEAKADGIEIYAIGLGSSINEEDLRKIASDPVEEHFFHPSTAEEIVDVFENLTRNLTAPNPYAGEAFGLGADALSTDPYTEAQVAETPRATTSPGEAQAVEVARQVGPYSVAFSVADVAVEGASGSENVTATATSRVTDLRVQGPDGLLVQADALRAEAHAWSSPSGQATEGATRSAGATVQGMDAGAAVPPNTEVPLPGVGSVTLNEQVRTESGENVTLRVNALHLEVDDGERTADVVAGSAYAAAACSVATGFEDPDDEAEAVFLDTVDEDVGAGPAAANPGGCANGTVAASATGCSEGDVAASGTGDAGTGSAHCQEASACVAASGTGHARNANGNCDAGSACFAASLTQEASNGGDECYDGSACVAVSGTSDAQNAENDCDEGSACVAASGTDGAENAHDDCDEATTCVAFSGTGDTENTADDCDDQSTCVAASGAGDSAAAEDGCEDQSRCVTLAGDGDAAAAQDCDEQSVCAAVSGTGNPESTSDDCEDQSLCLAASGTGETVGAGDECDFQSLCLAASGTGNAVSAEGRCEDRSLCGAASGAGGADGDLAVAGGEPTDPVTLPCTPGFDCVIANADHGGEGGFLVLSGSGDAGVLVGLAASGLGEAETGIGAAASGGDDAETGIGVAASGDDYAITGIGVAASGDDYAHADLGVAVSGTGYADADEGLAVSGCSGLEAEFGDTEEDVDSPAPVCGLPAAEGAPLLP